MHSEENRKGVKTTAISTKALVCLSPHSDDATLSCAGLLFRYREQGRLAHVVTIFSRDAPPSEALTPFARQLHHAWGDLANPMAHRREEDACALRLLGCSGTWWDYHDAIYRHPDYNTEERIFGRPAEETALESELVERCAAIPAEVLLFPLAIGHHIDHQLVFRVGWRLWQAGRRVAFYEDSPYVAWEGGPEGRLQELPRQLYPHQVRIDPFWPVKVEAVSCYASQFDALTHEGVSLLEALERYAGSLHSGGYVERLWWPEEDQWI